MTPRLSRSPAARLIRAGRLNALWVLLLGATAAIALLVVLLSTSGPANDPTVTTLKLHAAAGLKVPVEDIVAQYEEQYGVSVDLQLGGSNTLLNQLQVDKFSTADLYLAADDFYTDKAVTLGLAAETMPIALQRPVIAVRIDSPKQIASLEDLLKPDIAVAVANPEAAAVGKAVKQQLEQIAVDGTNRWAQLEAHVTESGVFKPTVNDVATDVQIGAVDAAITWDSTVAMPDFRDELKAIPIPELDTDPNLVSIAVLRSSSNPTAALKFARFISARDKGLKTFEKFGTRPVDGDVWSERPEITFFCGAVNRLATEKIIEEFSAREGVTVNTIYDGCGVLTSRMETIDDQKQALGFPDVYMACDLYYLENVEQWFQDAELVSDVELVIAVPKGSTKVKSLSDFLTPGVRVAIGEPAQCTIGALTRRLMQEGDLYDRLKEKQDQDGEVVVEKSSSAMLIPDVVSGHVDATVAYYSDVKANIDDVDIIRIESPLNTAIQPFSIAKTSDHKHLARRLFRRIADSPEAFESAGVHFRLKRDETTTGRDTAQ